MLGKGTPQERQCGLTGNSIVLAQPVTGRSVPELPPRIDALTSNILVVFTNSTQNLSTAKWATVDREQYLECAAFRKRVCPAYSEVNILQDFDEARLPRRGVPEALTECCIEACFFLSCPNELFAFKDRSVCTINLAVPISPLLTAPAQTLAIGKSGFFMNIGRPANRKFAFSALPLHASPSQV